MTTYIYNKQFRMAFIVATGCFLLCPLGFIALPQSRRQAKVRWGHIVRIFMYSAGGWALIMALILWSGPSRMGAQIGLTPWLYQRILMVTILFTPTFLLVWWSLATGRYLKMRHAWGVGLAVTTMAGLGAAIMAVTHYYVGW